MKLIHQSTSFLMIFLLSYSVMAQTGDMLARADKKDISGREGSMPGQKVVVVTGARFSYKLVQKWIDDYNKINPSIQIIIESRGSADPAQFDILAEVYQQDEEIRKNR